MQHILRRLINGHEKVIRYDLKFKLKMKGKLDSV
jgi:hypothetical protein